MTFRSCNNLIIKDIMPILMEKEEEPSETGIYYVGFAIIPKN